MSDDASHIQLATAAPTASKVSKNPTTKAVPGGKVSVETWGCQMNVADTETMLSLVSGDYKQTTHTDCSDLIILNTCHIREKAYHKVVSRLGQLSLLKKRRPHLQIVVAGCVAQAEGRAMLKKLPVIDVLIGPGRMAELPQLLKQRKHLGKAQIAIGFPRSRSTVAAPAPALLQDSRHLHPGKNPVSRYLTIQQGCNNYCTFCVVPHTRGPELSLEPREIIQRMQSMLQSGVKEICLLGQNVNSYGLDLGRAPSQGTPFYHLLKEALSLEGSWRLRFTTSNPHDLTREVADLFGKEPRLGRYFHLPVQSGSDAILRSMKRKVSRSEYLEKISWLRHGAPDMAISTDIIVGFPGETEEDFQQTCSLVQEVGYSFIYAFAYSPRKNTPARRFSKQIPREVQRRRLATLLDIQGQITTNLNRQEIGEQREVLFLYPSKKQKNAYYGRTQHHRLVKVCSTQNLVGHFGDVSITQGNKTALEGELLRILH